MIPFTQHSCKHKTTARKTRLGRGGQGGRCGYKGITWGSLGGSNETVLKRLHQTIYGLCKRYIMKRYTKLECVCVCVCNVKNPQNCTAEKSILLYVNFKIKLWLRKKKLAERHTRTLPAPSAPALESRHSLIYCMLMAHQSPCQRADLRTNDFGHPN